MRHIPDNKLQHCCFFKILQSPKQGTKMKVTIHFLRMCTTQNRNFSDGRKRQSKITFFSIFMT